MSTLARQLLKQETVSGSDVKEALQNSRSLPMAPALQSPAKTGAIVLVAERVDGV